MQWEAKAFMLMAEDCPTKMMISAEVWLFEKDSGTVISFGRLHLSPQMVEAGRE